MKKRIGIIGLGHISGKYKLGLEQSPVFSLISVCDISPNAINVGLYNQYPFYQDFEKMITEEKLDYVLISTPPRLHYEMALRCLELGCHVLLEKPGALKLDDLIFLIEYAKKKEKTIDVIYHWRYGNEVLFLERNLSTFGKIKSISINITDPYLIKPQTIDKSYYGLEGCWIDSSFNFLSLLALLIPLKSIVVLKHLSRYDSVAGLPFESQVHMKADDILINVKISWRMKKNRKVTVIETDKGHIEINHSEQAIYMNNEIIFQQNGIERLSTHYHNYFQLYGKAMQPFVDTLTVHQIALAEKDIRRSKNAKKR